MNTDRKMNWLVGLLTGAAVLALAVGCQPENTEVVAHGEDFPANDAVRPVHEFQDMQAARAARSDATMRKYHFDGADLNSLGEDRLDSMLKTGESTSPLTVFLDLPADDAQTADRKQAVIAYLKDRGLTQEQIVIKDGFNPDSHSLVAPLLGATATPAGAPGGANVTPPAALPPPAAH